MTLYKALNPRDNIEIFYVSGKELGEDESELRIALMQ